MDILIGKTAGFCYGVKNAVDETKKTLNSIKKTYCLGEIVHNKNVVNELQTLGLNVIENLNEIKSESKNINVVIRAHGVTPEVYNQIEKNEYDLIDLTCPNVSKIHDIAKEYRDKGYYIILIGQKQHPEVIGTFGFCKLDNKDNCTIIENQDEIDKTLNKLIDLNVDKILVIAQTTFSMAKFNNFVEYIKENINVSKLEIKNTICNATKIKQEETERLSKQVEYMIIIGGKNSSNTKKLYEIALENCNKAVIIENANELNLNEINKYSKIGIMAGASTPNNSIEEVVSLLKLEM